MTALAVGGCRHWRGHQHVDGPGQRRRGTSQAFTLRRDLPTGHGKSLAQRLRHTAFASRGLAKALDGRGQGAVQGAGVALDGSMTALQSLRSRVAEVLNRADMVEGRIAEQSLAVQTERSNAEDLDMVKAISDFQNWQTGYEAALKTYASVQRMSLFQYLDN